uniref:Uncharacterized protein n=1 Tax=Vitrella brassicaformis TaxID=1169539 RepID=A0A7S1KF30_9ALVE
MYFSHIPAHTHDHHHLRQGQGAAASDVTLLTAEGPRTADASATSAPASALAVLWGWMVYLEQLDIIHTVVGLLGSACLLSSNYFSHKAIHAMGLSCGHGHGAHAHSNGHTDTHGHSHGHGKSARGVTAVVAPLSDTDSSAGRGGASDDEARPLKGRQHTHMGGAEGHRHRQQ